MFAQDKHKLVHTCAVHVPTDFVVM